MRKMNTIETIVGKGMPIFVAGMILGSFGKGCTEDGLRERALRAAVFQADDMGNNDNYYSPDEYRMINTALNLPSTNSVYSLTTEQLKKAKEILANQ